MFRSYSRHHRTGGYLCALAALALAGSPASAAGPDPSETTTHYGAPVELGNGSARSYVILRDGIPTEVGIAMTESLMDELPAHGTGHHSLHMETHERILELPANHGTPFQFIELNWNPWGHEPAGAYEGIAHFDFHFYVVSKAERDAIDPTAPDFAARADRLPDPRYMPQGAILLAPPGAKPSEVIVPKMGVHWVDPRSHELQALLGNPDGYRPFTTTFIHGTWDGRVHFWEPMITRPYLMDKRDSKDPAVLDEVIELPLPKAYQKPGYYPGAYRIQWDPEAREYRVALTQLEMRG